jgi:hypothetical protein
MAMEEGCIAITNENLWQADFMQQKKKETRIKERIKMIERKKCINVEQNLWNEWKSLWMEKVYFIETFQFILK